MKRPQSETVGSALDFMLCLDVKLMAVVRKTLKILVAVFDTCLSTFYTTPRFVQLGTPSLHSLCALGPITYLQ